MNGFTFYFCVGKYGGWKFELDGKSLRIVCGWISIVFSITDMERDIEILLKVAEKSFDFDKEQP